MVTFQEIEKQFVTSNVMDELLNDPNLELTDMDVMRYYLIFSIQIKVFELMSNSELTENMKVVIGEKGDVELEKEGDFLIAAECAKRAYEFKMILKKKYPDLFSLENTEEAKILYDKATQEYSTIYCENQN